MTHEPDRTRAGRAGQARWRRLVASACVLLASVASLPDALAADLTLEEAIRLAVETHERSRIAKLQVDVAEADEDAALSELLPTLTLGANLTARPQEDRAGRHLTGSGTLTLRQPLVAPSAYPSYSAAGHSVTAQKHAAEATRREVAFDTARAFVQALAAERILKAAEARLERANANLQNAEARAEAELSSSNDATRARLERASAARDVSQSTGNLERAQLDLSLLVGRPTTGTLEPPAQLARAAETFAGESAKLEQAAIAQRPDLKQNAEQVLAARANADEPMYRLIPSLDLVGQVQVNPDPLPDESWHGESVALVLSWTIFDGGARYAAHSAREAQASSIELEGKLLARTVETQVRSSLVSLKTARDSQRIAEQAVETARVNSEETAILYQEGLARAIELTDANAQRFQAEVELASAKLAVAEAYLELRFAAGLTPVDAAGQSAGPRAVPSDEDGAKQ